MEKGYIQTGAFENNKRKNRFEFKLNTHLAYIDYIISNKTLLLINTCIPEELHSIDGLGHTFLRKVKQFSVANGLILQANCPYANALLKGIEHTK